MAKTVKDGTFATSDLGNLFDDIINSNTRLTERIVNVKNETNIFLCKILKYYTYKDMALVRILNDNSEIVCHLTHDVLSRDVSIRSMNSGTVGNDSKYGTYVIPHSDVYGIVAKVRWTGVTDRNCLISCVNLNNDDDLKNVVKDGEIVLTVGNSKISITNERVNIISPKIFVNGLPYDAPELTNYLDINQSDVISTTLQSTIELLEKKVDKLIELNDLDYEEES